MHLGHVARVSFRHTQLKCLNLFFQLIFFSVFYISIWISWWNSCRSTMQIHKMSNVFLECVSVCARYSSLLRWWNSYKVIQGIWKLARRLTQQINPELPSFFFVRNREFSSNSFLHFSTWKYHWLILEEHVVNCVNVPLENHFYIK